MALAVHSNPQSNHAFEHHFEPLHEVPKLRSNYGPEVEPVSISWMKESPATLSLDELRSRFRQDGYIFVKGLIPCKDVLDMREHYFSYMQDTGILEPGTSPREGIFNSQHAAEDHLGIGALDLGKHPELQQKIVGAHSTPEYIAFLKNPQLRGFVKAFMSWKDDILLERTMLRHSVPGGHSTGIHYDQIYLRAGNPRDEFLTAWVPLGDVAADGGGLMYLEDSSQLGRDIENDFMERAKDFSDDVRIDAFNSNMMAGGALSQNADEFGKDVGKGNKWLVANYEAGDVVFHDPYMIHCAAMNSDKSGRIRLSTDLRFYGEGMGLDKRWMNLWQPDDNL